MSGLWAVLGLYFFLDDALVLGCGLLGALSTTMGFVSMGCDVSLNASWLSNLTFFSAILA